MTNRNAEAPQGEGGNDAVPPPSQQLTQPQNQTQAQTQPQGQGANDNQFARGNNKVYKSGPLFLSSKGIGWTSWKKRWFILTRTSLVFYRSDPNVVPQKGSEVNLTLGGIDLNSSGSVVVKEDKKLLTVLFPDGRDGRDGRAFTLKAETSEDLLEWKAALEEALANAPSAALVMGQNGLFRNDQPNAPDASAEQAKDRQPVKSLVIGRPILLALEDIDGTPSFLEKALKFVEDHGVRVEGILRQAADVEDVERRIREFEQGKCEFTADEDAHVIADCVKYILRELPSSPVPASCCNALLEAYRTERSTRVNAMRIAICETFPEPNRRLLQRILIMMQSVASHKAVNRMSVSAVAACMAPLLLRPLLAGDCELEKGFDMGGDNSLQLMQAAAAANHAQAICITLLEEYNSLFGEGSASPEPYTDSEETGSETEELTDDDETYEDDEEDDYTTEGSDADAEDDNDQLSNATSSEIDETVENNKESECTNSDSDSPEVLEVYEPSKQSTSGPLKNSRSKETSIQSVDAEKADAQNSGGGLITPDSAGASPYEKSSKSTNGPTQSVRRSSPWGRTSARKNLSRESIDLPLDDEAEIERLEAAKAELQNRIATESEGNARLRSSLEERKNLLRERRLALERDVTRLQEQLHKEREIRVRLEAGLRTTEEHLAASSIIDERVAVPSLTDERVVKAEIEEIGQEVSDVSMLKQKADDLGLQVNQQREQNSRFQLDMSNHLQLGPNDKPKSKDKQKTVDTPLTPTPHVRERSSRNKSDNRPGKAEANKARKQVSSILPPDDDFLLNQQPEEQQQVVSKSSSTNSKKSSSKSEGTNSTSSALSKLSNRLNFLKERRSQITNELQSMDKTQSSGVPPQNSEARQPPLPNKPQGYEGQSSEKSKGSEKNLDRGKSDSFPPADKGRATGTPRQNSR